MRGLFVLICFVCVELLAVKESVLIAVCNLGIGVVVADFIGIA
jgi:hypothetical protein